MKKRHKFKSRSPRSAKLEMQMEAGTARPESEQVSQVCTLKGLTGPRNRPWVHLAADKKALKILDRGATCLLQESWGLRRRPVRKPSQQSREDKGSCKGGGGNERDEGEIQGAPGDRWRQKAREKLRTSCFLSYQHLKAVRTLWYPHRFSTVQNTWDASNEYLPTS